MTSNAILPGAKPLTDADRIALASTALAILRLPSMLRGHHKAFDMLKMLAGEPCWPAGYFLGEAHKALNAYSVQPNRHKQVDWMTHEETRAELERLVADALEKRRELIAEQEAFRAFDEREALITKLKAKGLKVP